MAESIPVQPVPTTYRVDLAETHDGGALLAITFTTPLGQQTYFFGLDGAEQFSNTVRQVAIKGKSGIVVARNVPDDEVPKIIDAARRAEGR